ncbi:cupin domain-containing protein [Neisseria shayeganii]|uniref:Protein of hypothetical function DUF861 cupin_3 n=1 Tax=Neisseria shayeganii 871 TaxID=1032488 RepID=G4CIP6_9NEIS|nr:cupin domain-containing protein [Neisseria shayeganii]EGY52293.1 protein of hypothetical function DUF861 cupin_3 [Neisseria shayeganii 871]
MSLTPLKKGITLQELDLIGPLTVLGGEILEGGEVKAYAKGTYGDPGAPISAGYFGTDKGRYRLVYPFSEQATIMQGEVRITDESTGETHHFKAGDSWFITKGTSTVWEVLTDNYTKHYLSFNE